MKNGIYHVDFRSGNKSAGQGLVVLKDGTVNGGDAGFLFVGKLLADSNVLSADIQVNKWSPGHVSIFGPLTTFGLTLSGQGDSAGGTFRLSGHITGQPAQTIGIHGRFLAPAA